MGWLRSKRPEWFGEIVDKNARLAQVKLIQMTNILEVNNSFKIL